MVEVKRVRLGDVAFEHKERIGEEAPDRPVYGVDKSVGLTAEPRYQSSNLSRYKRIEHGMFAYNPMRLNIGSIGFCHDDLAPGIVSPDYVVFGCREGALLPKFMDYHTRSAPWSDWLSLAGEGSVRERIYFRKLETYELALPDVPYQEAAVEILSALDDKIELNRRMNETLDALTQAIFKDWFVTFGPTRRKMEGATDPVAILGGLIPDPAKAAPLAALFPGSFGEDGLPEGWEDKGLDDVAEFLNGLALQKYPPTGDDDLPVIKIAELRGGITAKTNRANRTIAAKYLIKDGDFLFSWSGSLMAKFWTEGEGALNQHLFKVSSTTQPRWFYSHWVHHHMPEFQTIAASKATTMGHIQRGHLSAARVIVPPKPTLEAMTSIVEPLIERTIYNDLENRTLAETRDYLLPKLMSGGVRVRDVEAKAE